MRKYVKGPEIYIQKKDLVQPRLIKVDAVRMSGLGSITDDILAYVPYVLGSIAAVIALKMLLFRRRK